MNQEIPFLDLKLLNRRYTERYLEITKDTVNNAAFIGGPNVEKFEADFATYCEAEHAVGVANGTDAIQLALLALDIGPGQEVITAANTFYATVEAIHHTGAKVVLADCDINTFLLDPVAVEAAITPKTTAIVAVHLYGAPAPMRELREIADRHNLALIEDAAQAHGARYHGKRTGSLGDIAAFSFYPGKNLGACGDGGAVVTNDSVAAEKVRTLSQHGQSAKYRHKYLGFNSRLDSMQAAFLSEKLRDLDKDNADRRRTATYYDHGLARLDDVLSCPSIEPGSESVFHLYVVHVENRERLQMDLQKRGVATGLHYPLACHLQEGSISLGYQRGQFPVSEYNAGHCVSLPMFPGMNEAQAEYVVTQVDGSLKAARLSADTAEVSIAA